MPSESIAVFDLGGTWFRWGRYEPSRGLLDACRAPAVSYLSHPEASAEELQYELSEFIVRCTRDMTSTSKRELGAACVSIGAPVNAHDGAVLGSGPLWGPTAKAFDLRTRLRESLPNLEWLVINDIAALLASYMERPSRFRKTLLVTVSTGIGSRLYDHGAGRIPYDSKYGTQGEIGHLTTAFELDGELIGRRCECGGRNHLNAFASGRGIAGILRELPDLTERFATVFPDCPDRWKRASDEYRSSAFKAQLDFGNSCAAWMLDALVTPLCRILTTALVLDPDIDRIVVTGGVAHGLGAHYRASLQRTFVKEGLYQITDRDPDYLSRRLHWEDPDAFSGLRGAGRYADRILRGSEEKERS